MPNTCSRTDLVSFLDQSVLHLVERLVEHEGSPADVEPLVLQVARRRLLVVNFDLHRS